MVGVLLGGDVGGAVTTGASVPAGGSAAPLTSVNVDTPLDRPARLVSLDGRTIRSVDQDQTVANLYPLPSPLETTG